MKKEAYYFSHDSNARQDEKIIKLRMKLGWEGYGLYWALIEMLRDAKEYRLETDYTTIAFELRTECERIKDVVESYQLFTIEGNVFYSESLLGRMKLREAKSKKASEAAKRRWSKPAENQRDTSESNADVMRTHSESNAIKGKERKEKESKRNIFKAPSVAEIQDYFLERNIPNHNKEAEKFYDFYESKGWMVGKNKMKDWKAAVRNWSKNLQDKKQVSGGKGFEKDYSKYKTFK